MNEGFDTFVMLYRKYAERISDLELEMDYGFIYGEEDIDEMFEKQQRIRQLYGLSVSAMNQIIQKSGSKSAQKAWKILCHPFTVPISFRKYEETFGDRMIYHRTRNIFIAIMAKWQGYEEVLEW